MFPNEQQIIVSLKKKQRFISFKLSKRKKNVRNQFFLCFVKKTTTFSKDGKVLIIYISQNWFCCTKVTISTEFPILMIFGTTLSRTNVTHIQWICWNGTYKIIHFQFSFSRKRSCIRKVRTVVGIVANWILDRPRPYITVKTIFVSFDRLYDEFANI